MWSSSLRVRLPAGPSGPPARRPAVPCPGGLRHKAPSALRTSPPSSSSARHGLSTGLCFRGLVPPFNQRLQPVLPERCMMPATPGCLRAAWLFLHTAKAAPLRLAGYSYSGSTAAKVPITFQASSRRQV